MNSPTSSWGRSASVSKLTEGQPNFRCLYTFFMRRAKEVRGYRAGLQPAILYCRTTPRGRGVMQRCRLQRHCTSPPCLSTTDHYGSLSSRTALRCRWPCTGGCVPGLGAVQAATPLPDATFRRRVTDVEAVQSAMPVPGRGRISIAVGEEDEGRRTYGTRAHSTASPERANIGQKTWPRRLFYQ